MARIEDNHLRRLINRSNCLGEEVKRIGECEMAAAVPAISGT
jgi:hypothetical protein